MTYYLFYQPGHIPGHPGAYNNCRVDIDDEGNITQSPLPVPPADMATREQEVQSMQAERAPESTPDEVVQAPIEPAQETPPLSEPVPEEQPAEPIPPAETAEG